MSLTGSAEGNVLRGTINKCDLLTISAYGIAVKNGFQGTEAEWLESLKAEVPPVRVVNVTVLASAWQTEAESLHSQVITVSGVTPYSKVDLLPSVEQLAIFHNKDVTFVTENENGVVTVYAIGDKPTNDYTMQAQITEVTV